MTDCFLRVLHTSLLSAAGAAVVLLLRWLLRRLQLPSGLCVMLWMFLLLRMVIPTGLLPSAASLVSWAAPAARRQVETVAAAVRPPVAAARDSGPSQADPSAPAPAVQEAPQAAAPLSPAQALPWVWLAGMLVLWGYALFSWLGLRRRLSAAVRRVERPEGEPADICWWESDRISTPFVLGVLRPRIYVPPGVEGDTLVWVLRHESAHIRLGHPLCKLIFFLALGPHWFNPVLWLAWVLLCRDLELACDEHVLSRYPRGTREYSAALLCLAAPRPGPPLPTPFGEAGVRDRIRRALRWRPTARWTAAAGLLLCCVLGVLLFPEPATATRSDDLPAPASPSPQAREGEDGPYPELDWEQLRIRFVGSDSWTDLGPLLPAPAAWAEQDLAGRGDLDFLTNDLLAADPGLQVAFVSPRSGWLVYSSTQALGPLSDTCIYRTSDGGRTWQEVAYLTGQQDGGGDLWFSVHCAAFLDEDHAILATGLFRGAPVFCTGDGGATWEKADIPLPEGTWYCSDISAWLEEYQLVFTSPEGLGCVARSLDQGAVWSVSQPVADPEEIPLEALPWPASLPEGSFSPDPDNYYNGLVKLVGLSDDRTAALFAFDYWSTGLRGVLLCMGGQLTYCPQIPWTQLPAPHAAPLTYGDYDGDGVRELALQLCMGTGTGVNEWALYLFEPTGTGYTLSASLTRGDLAQADPSALDIPGLPQGAAVGYWVCYTVSETQICAEIGIDAGDDAPPDMYAGQLEGPIVYDGRTLSLGQLSYTPY